MRPEFVDLLACPDCGGVLSLGGSPAVDGHLLEGDLGCGGCGAGFAVTGGVARLLPGGERRSRVREVTAERFGYEWNQFADFDPEEERESLATWFAPRRLSDLAGLTVLDAGCGMGRHATIAAASGARRIVGIDLGDSVDAAFRNTRHLPSVCIVQGDVYHPPLRDGSFDAAYSVGVLHHLPDPAAGFAALAPKVRVDGWFQVWVYGREGNGWIVHLVNPVRRLTCRMPLAWLKTASWPLAIPLLVVARSLYRTPGLGPRLPYAAYLRWLSGFSLRKVHAIVFDHLLTPVAHYLSRSQVEAMVDLAGWSIGGLVHNRGMSWGVTVERRV